MINYNTLKNNIKQFNKKSKQSLKNQKNLGSLTLLMSPLVQKLVFVTIIPIVIGLGLLAVLMMFQYQKMIRTTVEQGYILSIGEIKSRSEQWLKYGVNPENIPNMQGILNSIAQQINGEFSIDIINNEGIIVYSLDSSRLRDIVPTNIVRDINILVNENYNNGVYNGNNQYRIFNSGDQRSITAPLFNNFGEWAIAAIISFPQSTYINVIGDTAYRMLYYFAAISIAITLIGLLLSSFLLRNPVAWLRYLNQRFLNLNSTEQKLANENNSPFEIAITNNLRDMEKATRDIHKIDNQQEILIDKNKSKTKTKTKTKTSAKAKTSAKTKAKSKSR